MSAWPRALRNLALCQKKQGRLGLRHLDFEAKQQGLQAAAQSASSALDIEPLNVKASKCFNVF